MSNRIFCFLHLLLFWGLPGIPLAQSAPKPMAPSSRTVYFEAASVVTFQGQIEVANQFDHIDFKTFNAGSGIVLDLSEGYEDAGNSITLKGFVFFDLNAGNMRNLLSHPGDDHIVLSFILEQVRGQPRPLRVEYIGTFGDVSSKQACSRGFGASPILQVNNVLRQNASPGLKLVDMTGIAGTDLSQRWLVFRFEQQGLRIESSEQDDLYQFNPSADSVRLTLSDKDVAGRRVAGHYADDFGSGIITDMPKNLLGDMPKDLTSDMPKDLTSDMPKDLTSDMPKNLLQDMPNNPIMDEPGK